MPFYSAFIPNYSSALYFLGFNVVEPVSHNGLVRQKGEYAGGGWTGQTEKFVKNAERFPSTRVELCVSAQI